MSIKIHKTRQQIDRIFSKYLSHLTEQAKGHFRGQRVKGNRSKKRILAFYTKNGRWPSRLSSNANERQLGTRFEIYISKEAKSYDSKLRRIALALGRKTNNKRKHNPADFKLQILSFIKEHGHAPGRYSNQKFEGEGNLKAKLDYYTLKKNDMTFLGQVYEADKCHRSGIPNKYRALLNEQLNVKKPLIRLV